MKKKKAMGWFVVVTVIGFLSAWAALWSSGQAAAAQPQAMSAAARPQTFALSWDAPADEEGRLLPTAVADPQYWRLVAELPYQVIDAVPLSESRVAVWTGEALLVIERSEGNWYEVSRYYDVASPIPTEAPPTEEPTPTEELLPTPTETPPLSRGVGLAAPMLSPESGPTVSFDLFLDGSIAVAASDHGENLCTSGDGWYVCEAEGLPRVEVLALPDGRWLFASASRVYDVGWTAAQAVASRPLSIWQEVTVVSPAISTCLCKASTANLSWIRRGQEQLHTSSEGPWKTWRSSTKAWPWPGWRSPGRTG